MCGPMEQMGALNGAAQEPEEMQNAAAVTTPPAADQPPADQPTTDQSAASPAPAFDYVGSARTPIDGGVTALLEKYGMNIAQAHDLASNLGLETADDFQMVTESDLVGAGMKPIQARKLLASIKPAPSPAAPPTGPAPFHAVSAQSDYGSILPAAPTNESWLKALKAGGVLKVGTEAYVSAIRVVFASKVGLYDLPQKIADAMEAFADETDAPVPDEFYKVRRDITRHNYADIFSAIEGLDGTYVTEKRRKEFLYRVNQNLWPAIRDAYVVLNGWREGVKAVNSDLSNVIDMLMSGVSGVGAALPPFDAVTDASETLKDTINHIFRGVGGPVAAAMAYDAEQIASYLENPTLPQLLGVANRDQMLKKLGTNVSPNYARQEPYVVRFVLSYVKFSDGIAAGEEARYLTALWQLGNMINWESLGIQGGSSAGLPGIAGNRVL